MMASDFSMRAKWRALKSGWRSAPQKVLDRGNMLETAVKALIAEVDSGGCREVSFEEVWNIIPLARRA